MSNPDQAPIKLATVELLTQEIAFQNPKQVVAEINKFHEKNIRYDREYYELVGAPPSGDEKTIGALMQILERHFQQAGSMEYHALVRAPSSEDSIPRIGDAILLRNQLLRALDIVRDLIQYKRNEASPDKQNYLEYFLQRWIYKFCRHIFDTENMREKLVSLFEPEQKKGKEGFKSLSPIIQYLSDQQAVAEPGYDAANMRRLYVVFGNLLFAYFRRGVPIPFHLQKIFIEFQKGKFFDYEQLSEEHESVTAERKNLLIPVDNVRPFFMQFKEIKSPMKKSVLIGILVEPERKFIVENFCRLGIRGAGEMYKFIGNKLSVANVTEAQGRDWLINTYDTITKVVKEQKILENPKINESIRALFGDPISFPVPAFRDKKQKKGVELSPEMADRMLAAQQSDAAPPAPVEVEPEVIDIPNLVAAQNLKELEDKGRTKSIVIVQDANVLDLVVKNWEIRGSLTFPELIEFVRIPFQIYQAQAPGIREGRRFVSFAYLIALGLSEEHIRQLIDKLGKTEQVSEERIEQLHRIYPIAMENIGELQKLNRDARPLLSSQGNIIPNIFLEKCETLQKIFMEKYSYIQSLLSYWIIVEEIYFTIAKNIAGLGEIKGPTPSEIEQFVASKNDTYMDIYEKALMFAGPLKMYFKKKYNPELQHHFVNVKIKNDLLNFAETEPVNLAER
ncbi:MAG: hypothetical protein HQM14_17900 [SAR324 cluster bacterium]|nr:hypothetical protein [SAR324 cluster bacterium]